MHDEAYRLIPLRARDGSVRAEARVSPEDYGWLNQWRWSGTDLAGPYPYAVRRERDAEGAYRRTMMHRRVLGIDHDDPRQVDHINRDTLDNRRENLRAVTRSQNLQNQVGGADSSSCFRGVAWDRRRRSWTAYASVDGLTKWLGYFDSETAAADVAEAYRTLHMTHNSQDTMTHERAVQVLGRKAATMKKSRRLTDADVFLIRWMRFSTSVPGCVIAETLDVTQSTVSVILHGRSRPMPGAIS